MVDKKPKTKSKKSKKGGRKRKIKIPKIGYGQPPPTTLFPGAPWNRPNYYTGFDPRNPYQIKTRAPPANLQNPYRQFDPTFGNQMLRGGNMAQSNTLGVGGNAQQSNTLQEKQSKVPFKNTQAPPPNIDPTPPINPNFIPYMKDPDLSNPDTMRKAIESGVLIKAPGEQTHGYTARMQGFNPMDQEQGKARILGDPVFNSRIRDDTGQIQADRIVSEAQDLGISVTQAKKFEKSVRLNQLVRGVEQAKYEENMYKTFTPRDVDRSNRQTQETKRAEGLKLKVNNPQEYFKQLDNEAKVRYIANEVKHTVDRNNIITPHDMLVNMRAGYNPDGWYTYNDYGNETITYGGETRTVRDLQKNAEQVYKARLPQTQNTYLLQYADLMRKPRSIYKQLPSENQLAQIEQTAYNDLRNAENKLSYVMQESEKENAEREIEFKTLEQEKQEREKAKREEQEFRRIAKMSSPTFKVRRRRKPKKEKSTVKITQLDDNTPTEAQLKAEAMLDINDEDFVEKMEAYLDLDPGVQQGEQEPSLASRIGY